MIYYKAKNKYPYQNTDEMYKNIQHEISCRTPRIYYFFEKQMRTISQYGCNQNKQ